MTTKALTRPYHSGSAGAPNIAQAEIDFSAAAARQLICTLPANSVVTNAWVEVVTAFNAGTSNLLTLGWGAIAAGTADDYVATVTEGTPGVYGQATPGLPFAVETADKDVYIYYTPGAADATTGKAYGFVAYSRLANNG